jgi:5-methylcytosine-specific restriction enzyme subunit McrC
MKPPLTFFEHEPRLYHDLGWSADAPALAAIERLNDAARCEYFRVGRHALTARQFVGVLRIGGETIQVLPKIDHGAGTSDSHPSTPSYRAAAQSAARNLLHLLSYTHELEVREADVAALDVTRSTWFELLTRLFAQDLYRLAQQGFQHGYVGCEDNLPVLKGRWLLSRQLTRNQHMLHRFDVAYDEFTVNTTLNQVLATAVARLAPRSEDSFNRSLLADLDGWLSGADRLPRVTAQTFAAVHFSRLNERFRPAFNLARLFLEGQAEQVRAGQTEAYAFMFDMNALFELFVARFLARYKNEILPPQWQSAQIIRQGEKQGPYLATRLPDGQNAFHLKPDLMLRAADGRPLLVLDTKYKALRSDSLKSGVAEGDAYQMLAYAVRLACPAALMLYPQWSGAAPLRAQYEVTGYPARLSIATIDLHRPLDCPQPLIQELRQVLTPSVPPAPMPLKENHAA